MGLEAWGYPTLPVSPMAFIMSTSGGLACYQRRHESVCWLGNDLMVIITCVYFIHTVRKRNYHVKARILHILLPLGNEMKWIQIRNEPI